MQRYTLSAIIGISALLIGVTLGASIFGGPKPQILTNDTEEGIVATPSSPELSDLTGRVDGLIARLEDSESRLQAHQNQLKQLNQELLLQSRASRSTAEVVKQVEAGQIEEVVTAASQAINAASFVDAGFAVEQAQVLEERYADLELRRLYLRDRALREGWISEPRFGEERARLDAEEGAIADELGYRAYDRYLYATGQPNRLSVSSVIRKSPAEESGIRSGDIFYSYAGTRVYDSSDLRNASSNGNAGASVAVEVLRDDSIIELYIPRGPLGVQLENDSVRP